MRMCGRHGNSLGVVAMATGDTLNHTMCNYVRSAATVALVSMETVQHAACVTGDLESTRFLATDRTDGLIHRRSPHAKQIHGHALRLVLRA